MSYDFELFVGRTFTLDAPDPGPSTLLSCDGPARLEQADVPVGAASLIGRRRVILRPRRYARVFPFPVARDDPDADSGAQGSA